MKRTKERKKKRLAIHYTCFGFSTKKNCFYGTNTKQQQPKRKHLKLNDYKS